MSELKITTHTVYTYETSDGREFDNPQEAQEWQQALEDLNGITMLDSNFKLTTQVTEAFYVHIKTQAQLDAFALVQEYEGACAPIEERGCWYYDECTDSYVNLEKEINRLKDIKLKIYENSELLRSAK